MRIIDPHVHCYSRTTADYEAMKLAGVEVVVEPAFWLGSDRRYPGTFFDYFRHISEYEPTRAAKYGIQHFSCIACNPKEAEDLGLATEVLAGMGEYLDAERVVAVGEIGFNNITENEETVMRRQVEMALERNMLILVHTPHVEKRRGTARTIAIMEEMEVPPDTVLLDHNDETTIDLARQTPYWCGHTVYPFTKLSPDRFCAILRQYGTERMLVNSAADWGPSDPLSVAKVVVTMRHHGFTDEQIEQVVWHNPNGYFGQDDRFVVAPPQAPQGETALGHWLTGNY